jgi:hypothetical protein
VLEWALNNGCNWESVVIDAAATTGHLNVLQWAQARGHVLYFDEISRMARMFDYIDIIKWCEAQHTVVG